MLPQSRESGEAALVRALGVRQLTAAIINVTVGAGIFVLPALVSQGLGAAAPLAFLICAGAMLLIVTTFALAGSRVSLTGGLYAYVEVAFGPFVGFLTGVLQWLSFSLSVSGVASALMDQMGTVMPVVGTPLGRLLTLFGMLVILAVANIRGVRTGTRVVEIVTAAKLAPLLLFVAVGVFFVQPAAIAWPGLPDTDAIGKTVLLLIFAFVGVEVALAPSGEVSDPARTVPRALFLALTITTVLYMAVQLVAQGVLGQELAQHGGAPLAEAAGRFLGGAGRALILLGGVVSMFGYVSGDMLSSPRNLYAFGRDGFLPAVFARIDPVYRTPRVAICVHAMLVFLLAGSSTFQYLAVLSNVAVLSLYFVCCCAALELMRRDVRMGGVPFAIPGARLVPLLAAGAIVWILSSATRAELAVTAGVIALATLIYVLRKSVSSRSLQSRVAWRD